MRKKNEKHNFSSQKLSNLINVEKLCLLIKKTEMSFVKLSNYKMMYLSIILCLFIIMSKVKCFHFFNYLKMYLKVVTFHKQYMQSFISKINKSNFSYKKLKRSNFYIMN